ncbi:hypothetical protein V6Z12_A11G087200, partial [Gossypium hirsutum]
MSNLTKLEFVALDITGNNYLSWVLDAEIMQKSTQDKAKAMIFLRHHLHEGLKTEYLIVNNPQILWANLKERYDHQKVVITSQLNLCREKITDAEMLEKTYSTFHANNVVLQTQYREKGFQKYSELIFLSPSGGAKQRAANEKPRITPNWLCSILWSECDSVRGRGRSRGRGRGHFKNSHSYQKWDRKNGNREEKEKGENVTNVCYRYGGKGRWSRVCRTQKHLVDLYQQSIKQKEKKVETNLVYKDGE